jgi:hypothetical protein
MIDLNEFNKRKNPLKSEVNITNITTQLPTSKNIQNKEQANNRKLFIQLHLSTPWGHHQAGFWSTFKEVYIPHCESRI